LVQRLHESRSVPTDPALSEKRFNALRMIVEAARFAAMRDDKAFGTDCIIGMADATNFHAVAHETWSVDGPVGYRMPLSLRAEMRSYCSSFGLSEMSEFHRSLVSDLKAVLPSMNGNVGNHWNIHRAIRERKIGIVRIDRHSDDHDRLLNMVIAELELAMTETSYHQVPRETKSVVILNDVNSWSLRGVYDRLVPARARNIVIMADSMPASRKVNVARIKDAERLGVEMAWARQPDHPNEFEVLDPRPRFLEWTLEGPPTAPNQS
jgi:hypothetical protein